ncbi:MAG: right-handed parallel beta-helix repeat-containing protein, partial [Lentisphaeria bacterium]|nr:right-handed parallel beta-helix repeat-containing protein [Lentisphaeria bacterium]
MRMRGLVLSIALGVLPGGHLLPAATSPVLPGPDRPPQWVTPAVEAPRLLHRTFESAAVGAPVSYHVYVPECYDMDPSRRFPVLYYLHGSGGGLPGLRPLAARFDTAIRDGRIPPLLVVFPNGLPYGMWVDWRDGSIPGETVVARELVPHIDATFRTLACREGRMVEGFSMGGYGAARFGFKYPDLFGAVSTLSGGPLQPDFREAPRVGPRQREEVFQAVFGGNPARFLEQSPWALAEANAARLRRGTPIRVVIGDRDEMLPITKRFAAHLTELGIPHTYTVLPGVGHNPMAVFAAMGETQWTFYRAALGTEFHVSPEGRRDGDGSPARPFAALHQARDAARRILAEAGPGRPLRVTLHGGLYELAGPLLFGPEDSGSAAMPVVYAAAPGEAPVLSAGRRLGEWQVGPDGRWKTTLPEVRDGAWYPSQLFLGGRRCVRARTPNEGFLRTEGPPRFGPEDRQALDLRFGRRVNVTRTDNLAKFGFRYREGDLQPWDGLEDAVLHVMHAWTGAMHWIAHLDPKRRTVRFTGPSRFPNSRFEVQMPYFVENIPEALDAPGEWYADRATGMLTYCPMPGEMPGAERATVSRLQTLLRLRGDAEAGLFVEGLEFRGLAFEHTDWGPLDPEAENDGYGGTHFLEAAIVAAGARHCTFERCSIRRCGGYGVYLIDGSSHNRLEHCEIADLGGGGILIGCRWSPYDTFRRELPPDAAPESLLCAHNTVHDTFIHHGGQVFRGVLGIFLAHAPYNRVTHNEICAMPYSGICVGRRLDRKHSHAHHNEIAHNHLHHLG